jgi:hypothetical protein
MTEPITEPGAEPRADALEVHHLSWARRAGKDVEVRLLVLGPVEPGTARVELTDGGHARLSARAQATPEGDGVALQFSVPQSSLGGSTWQLALSGASDTSVPISARLLAAPQIPVALLPGPAPETLLRPPAPRRREQAGSLASRWGRRLPAPARNVLRSVRDRGLAAARRVRR